MNRSFTRIVVAAWACSVCFFACGICGAQDKKAAPAGVPAADQPRAGAGDKTNEKRESKPADQPDAEAGDKVDDQAGDQAGDQASDEAQPAGDEAAAVAVPVPVEPMQVFGFEEWVEIGEIVDRMRARLDTGAATSSLHVDEEELFERDGEKWVRFIVSVPGEEQAKRVRISAPLVRTARIKVAGGESEVRKVVRLNVKIGDRKLRTEFSLSNRDNMHCPVLLGRNALQELGWVDAGRTYLAEKKIIR